MCEEFSKAKRLTKTAVINEIAGAKAKKNKNKRIEIGNNNEKKARTPMLNIMKREKMK